MVHCRLGIPERRVGDGRRCACYGYAAAARRRRSREYSFSCTPGWRPGVSRAALLHGRLQLSSAQPRVANPQHCYRQRPIWTRLSHTVVCIAQIVCSSSHRQRSFAVYNGCREAGTTTRASGGLRAARIAPTTRNHGCNIEPMPVLQTMVCTRDANCTPVLQTMVCQTEVQIASLVQFWMFFTTCTKVVFKVVFPCTTASGGHGGRSGGVSAKGSPCQARSCRYGSVTHVPHGVTLTTVVMICMYRP